MSTNSLIEPLSTPTSGQPAILILNGPNLVNVGQREAEIYGSTPLVPYLEQLAHDTTEATVAIRYSHYEGALIEYLYMAQELGYQAVILNAGGYTHTSVAIADAIRAIALPVIEVHISQPLARESYRHTSLIAPYCRGNIAGFGVASYDLAVRAAIQLSR